MNKRKRKLDANIILLIIALPLFIIFMIWFFEWAGPFGVIIALAVLLFIGKFFR